MPQREASRAVDGFGLIFLRRGQNRFILTRTLFLEDKVGLLDLFPDGVWPCAAVDIASFQGGVGIKQSSNIVVKEG